MTRKIGPPSSALTILSLIVNATLEPPAIAYAPAMAKIAPKIAEIIPPIIMNILKNLFSTRSSICVIGSGRGSGSLLFVGLSVEGVGSLRLALHHPQ